MSQPTVIFNHGMESGPWGSKIKQLAAVAEQAGWQVVSVDYTGMYDAQARVDKLLADPAGQATPLVLVGSSMGGYVAAAASAHLRPVGLFLLAPAFFVPVYPEPAPTPQAQLTVVIHGWQDEIIPAEHSLRYAQSYPVELHLLTGTHRLMEQMPLITLLFQHFLHQVKPV